MSTRNPQAQDELPDDADSRRVISTLREWPDAPVPDLAGRVLATIHRTRRNRRLALAAALAITIGGAASVLLVPGHASPRSASDSFPVIASESPAPHAATSQAVDSLTPPEDPALALARDWLIHAQDADGGWSMGRTGAGANYAVGTSALAILALAQETGDEARDTVDRAIAYLLRMQSPDGLFGPAITGSLYNHVLATYALLRHDRPDDRTRHAIANAVALLARTQRAEGGWTYLRASGGPNSSLTAWVLLVLTEAEARGDTTLSPVIARASEWLAGTVDAEGRAGYRRPGDHPNGSETLTAAVALSLMRSGDNTAIPLARMLENIRHDTAGDGESIDLYRVFLQTAALRAGPSPDAELGHIAARLRALQEPSGRDAGSWPPLDRWSSAGGRAYSTALALLTLRST